MSQAKDMLSVSGIDVEIVRKDIKNLHLAVYPPNGHVRVAVPKHVTDDNVRLAIISRLSWIKKQQKAFAVQPRQSERLYVSGECHYYFGKRYRLELIERMGKHEIVLLKSGKLKMFVRPNTSVVNKEKLLDEWYRAALKKRVPELIEKWQPIIGEELADWGIRKMKTKWGSCNPRSESIRLNTELAKKLPECLEYVVVHEMAHLLEPTHNNRFIALVDSFLPRWKYYREMLNRSTLSHESWRY